MLKTEILWFWEKQAEINCTWPPSPAGPITFPSISLSWSETQTEASASVYYLPSSVSGQTRRRLVYPPEHVGCRRAQFWDQFIFFLYVSLWLHNVQAWRCSLCCWHSWCSFMCSPTAICWTFSLKDDEMKKQHCRVSGQMNVQAKIKPSFGYIIVLKWKNYTNKLVQTFFNHLTNISTIRSLQFSMVVINRYISVVLDDCNSLSTTINQAFFPQCTV